MTAHLHDRRQSLPAPSKHAHHWSLTQDLVYLNHGSFGATPTAIQQHQSDLRAHIEREPVDFYVNQLFPEMDRVRAAFATHCGGAAPDYVMVPNATTAVATILHNRRFQPGDELLTTTHNYPACKNTLHAAAERDGATVVEAKLPFPIASPEQAIDAILAAVTDRTRFAMIDHVTSPTALVLPVKQIVAELSARGIDTLIDGAHAPGMLDVDLAEINAAYYTANAHKWFCAPKGSAFLHVREDKQQGFRPLALSNQARQDPPPGRSKFNLEFDYTGTLDPTPWLATPAAIDFLQSLLPGGLPELRDHNRALCLQGRQIICKTLNVEPPCPESMIGSIATVPLPPHPPELDAKLAARPTKHHDALQDALIERHRVQVPVWSIPGEGGARVRFVRISAQLYNSPGQYEYLAGALVDELDRERGV